MGFLSTSRWVQPHLLSSFSGSKLLSRKAGETMTKYLITLTAAAAVLVGCEQRNVEKASKDFNQLPAAVQKTVRAQAPDAEIAGVDQKTRDGVTVYKIQFRDKDRHPAMEVATDGTLMRYEAGKPASG